MSEPTPTVPTAPTTARPRSSDSAHWYYPDGLACHQVPKAEGGGMRNATLRDARKLGLLPSVTGILKILHKEALVNWKMEQVALAVLSAPKLAAECGPECPHCKQRQLVNVDAFAKRVIQVEEQHEAEGKIACDRGAEIHDGLDLYLGGLEVDAELLEWIAPAAEAIRAFGNLRSTETALVGPGYAGRSDGIMDADTHWVIGDWKSSKTLPDPAKGAWMEHRLQLAAYARAWRDFTIKTGMDQKPILCRNVYISTINRGEFVICEHEEDWQLVYVKGFAPLVTHWQWATGYTPPSYKEPEQRLNDPKSETVPVLQTPPPAPTNGPARVRKTVVTHGQRVSPAGVPLPLPPPPPTNQ